MTVATLIYQYFKQYKFHEIPSIIIVLFEQLDLKIAPYITLKCMSWDALRFERLGNQAVVNRRWLSTKLNIRETASNIFIHATYSASIFFTLKWMFPLTCDSRQIYQYKSWSKVAEHNLSRPKQDWILSHYSKMFCVKSIAHYSVWCHKY